MENKIENKLSVGKIILIIILMLLILMGIFGAGCGGIFIYAEIFESSKLGGVFFMSIPSLIIGLLLIFGGYKGIKKILR